jgi:hypothetical protein
MLIANAMARLYRQPSLSTDQRQVLGDNNPTVVKKDVVVGAQAQDVVGDVWPVVGRSEGSYVRGLRIGTGEAL